MQLGTLVMMQLPELEDELDAELLELDALLDALELLEVLDELDALELLLDDPPPQPATVSAPMALNACRRLK